MIEETLEVIQAFNERYVPFILEQGVFTDIRTVNGKVCFTFNNDYSTFAWLDAGELHIETERGESIFDCDCEACFGWTQGQIHYMRFGYGKVKDIIRRIHATMSEEDVEMAACDIVDRCFELTPVPQTDAELVAYVKDYLNR